MRRLELAAEVYVGVAEKTEAMSAEPQLKLGADDVTDDGEQERLQAAGEGAATLTNPVSRLRRGSAHRPLAPPLQEADGSKEKWPL